MFHSYIARNGRYVDGHVRYVQNPEKYASLEELGIPVEQVEVCSFLQLVQPKLCVELTALPDTKNRII